MPSTSGSLFACQEVNRQFLRARAGYKTIVLRVLWACCPLPEGRIRKPQLSVEIPAERDRKSTRLNSSHQIISYHVFCLKTTKPSHILYKSQTNLYPSSH